MISNSHFADFKGTNSVIFIDRTDSNLRVFHCGFEDCYRKSYYSYPKDGHQIGGVCIIHNGNNASLNYISCCSCKVDYDTFISTFNQNQPSNSHIYNEISFHNCVSPSYFILTDISPAYFYNINSSNSKSTAGTLFHSGWGSVGCNSTFWTLSNNTCFILLGHSNTQNDFYFLKLLSNQNQYIFQFYNRGSTIISNSIILGNNMRIFNTGTLTLDNCIYDKKDDFNVNPNCKLAQTYSIYIVYSCLNFYQCACSIKNYCFRSKYMYSFIIALI